MEIRNETTHSSSELKSIMVLNDVVIVSPYLLLFTRYDGQSRVCNLLVKGTLSQFIVLALLILVTLPRMQTSRKIGPPYHKSLVPFPPLHELNLESLRQLQLSSLLCRILRKVSIQKSSKSYPCKPLCSSAAFHQSRSTLAFCSRSHKLYPFGLDDSRVTHR